MRSAIDKYLSRYAEDEHRIAAQMSHGFRQVLVVPACGEDAGFLHGLSPCSEGDALCIVVVNASEDAPAQIHVQNQALLAALPPRTPLSSDPPAWLTEQGGSTLLIVDRASPGRRLPRRQGVGLARRIGFDLALALGRRGLIGARFIASTDADAHLPADYFAALDAAPADAAALCFPFVHVPSGDAALDRATELYELGLHYYVEGLRHARSPYAFHTLGSALAIDAEAYARVRGFPRRLAGEDFHLLDKVAKVGRVVTAASEPIRIRARRSERVPFGTGPGVARIEAELAAGIAPRFYHPQSFELLGIWLAMLDRFAEHRDPRRLSTEAAADPTLERALVGLGALEVAERELGQSPDAAHLRRRLRTSFGALPTLRLVHALRDAGLGLETWSRAIAAAPFRDQLPCVAGPPQPRSSQPLAADA
jgi:hypothetical protein